MKQTVATESGVERALLVGVETPAARRLGWRIEDSLDELADLAATAGAQVVGAAHQSLRTPTPAHYVGSGKLDELKEIVHTAGVNLVILDDELSPVQQRNLENALAAKIIDRTALILDIFAARARTREGRLQVELAQAEYLLPRLAGQWSHLERLGGGIGTRGPGESQLETDRRLVRRRIQHLKEQLEGVRRTRALHRQRRRREATPVVALVGYTNAGKSTLLNALTGAGVVAHDRPFETLDPTTRQLHLPSGRQVLLTDTVGFIHKLPTQLIAAFRATLEELGEADLLLHVVDLAHPNAAEQAEAVDETLDDLSLQTKPRIVVLNKFDLCMGDEAPDAAAAAELSAHISQERGSAVATSATQGWGLDHLRGAIEQRLDAGLQGVTLEIPYRAAEVLELLRARGHVEEEEYHATGARVRGRIPGGLAARVARYRVS